MLRLTEHFGFTVRNLETSVRFYSALLGQAPFYEASEARDYVGRVVGYPGCSLKLAFFHLPETDSFLELLEYVAPIGVDVSLETCNPGVAHLCFVVDDLDEEYRRIATIGGVFRHDRPVQRADGGRAVYLRDPDGITIELQEPTHA